MRKSTTKSQPKRLLSRALSLSATNDLEFPKASDRAGFDWPRRRGNDSQPEPSTQVERAPGKTCQDRSIDQAPSEAREAGSDEPQTAGDESRHTRDLVTKSPTVAEFAALQTEVRCLRETVSALADERDYLRRLLEKELDDRRKLSSALLPGARQPADGATPTTAREHGLYQQPNNPSAGYMSPADAGFPQSMMMRRRGRMLPLAVAVVLIIIVSFMFLDKLLLLNSALSEW